MKTFRKAAIGLLLATSTALPAVAVAAPDAGATASNCQSYITSTGQPGGAVSGICYGGSGWWQEIGLCQNIFTRSSRWVSGNWVNSGVSLARCAWYEVPRGGYVHLGS